MAEGVLGLGAGAASLNNDLIDKLKKADRKAKIEPIEVSLESWDKEKETITSIKEKVDNFLNSVKVFDLFGKAGENAFNQISANASGDSVIFDAEDINKLKEGVTNISVEALAKTDIYQMSIFSSSQRDGIVDATNELHIQDKTYSTNQTYDELLKEINTSDKFSASIEQVGDDQFRMVIKSKESGLSNKLNISLENTNNINFSNVQEASNLRATIDGVNYNLPTNKIDLSNGLKVTAVKVDEEDSSSSISIANDNSQVEKKLNEFVKTYNELVAVIDSEVYSADSSLNDKSALRNMMDNIKGIFFESYGTTSDGNGSYLKDKSIFNYGFELGKDGSLSIDSKILNKAITDDFQGLKDLFVGSADTEARGLGTQLKEYIDFGINSSLGGILNIYENHMDSRQSQLKEDKEKAIEALDNKYKQLATQYAAYGGIINSFQSSFGGLKMMIAQSVSSN